MPKMNIKLLLFLLPLVAAQKQLRVQFEISEDFSEAEAEVSGESEEVITDDELTVFGITSEAISNGVYDISEKNPDEIIFKDSGSDCGSVYKNKGWQEVTREFDSEKATILNIQHKTVVLATKEISNNNTAAAAKIDSELACDLPDTISTSWGKFNGITDSSTQIEYKVQFENSGTELRFSLPLGQNTENSEPVAVIGTDERCPDPFVELEPNETVTVELVATQIIVNAQLEYEVDFEGDVVCVYGDNESFERFDIEDVLKKSSLPKEVIVNESVQVVVHADVKILVQRNNSERETCEDDDDE